MKHYIRTSSGVSKSYIEWDQIPTEEDIQTRMVDRTQGIVGNLGAGAAILAEENDLDDCICVGAQCAVEEGMTSLTLEQVGVIIGVVAISVLIQKFDNPPTTLTITFWIDNEETLDRTQHIITPKIKLREYDVSDY